MLSRIHLFSWILLICIVDLPEWTYQNIIMDLHRIIDFVRYCHGCAKYNCGLTIIIWIILYGLSFNMDYLE